MAWVHQVVQIIERVERDILPAGRFLVRRVADELFVNSLDHTHKANEYTAAKAQPFRP
jgi:hypothetical protein